MIVKPTIDRRVKKDGTGCIKVSISHNGETRYISTDLHCLPNEFSNGRFVRRTDAAILNNKLQKQLLSITEAVNKIEYIECLTCNELIYLINEKRTIKNPTLAETYKRWIESRNCTESSLIIYRSAYNRLVLVLDPSTRLQNIHTDMINDVVTKLRKLGYKENSIIITMNCFRAIWNFAYNKEEIVGKSPFEKSIKAKATIKDSWLELDDIRYIRDFYIKNLNHAYARDIFMLSYYLGGMNQVDIFKQQFLSDKVTYTRTKTENRHFANSKTEFAIHPKAQEIINRYKNKEGYLIPPTISDYGNWLAKRIKILSQDMGIDFSFYSARKSVSEVLFEMGCPTSIIDYLLGHSIKQGTNCLYRYIKVSPALATQWLWKAIDAL